MSPSAGYEPFAEGWLQGGRAWRRPADGAVMPDGALIVSDDEANVLYSDYVRALTQVVKLTRLFRF